MGSVGGGWASVEMVVRGGQPGRADWLGVGGILSTFDALDGIVGVERGESRIVHEIDISEGIRHRRGEITKGSIASMSRTAR
jgi:hypothetical protein